MYAHEKGVRLAGLQPNCSAQLMSHRPFMHEFLTTAASLKASRSVVLMTSRLECARSSSGHTNERCARSVKVGVGCAIAVSKGGPRG